MTNQDKNALVVAATKALTGRETSSGTNSSLNPTTVEPQAQQQCPEPLPVIAANIPDELKEIPQWVCWKYTWNGKKWTKPPYQPNGYKASKTNTAHFFAFSDVIAAYEKGGFSGVGFILTKDDPFVAIDIDHCLEGKVLTDEARDIIKALNSYTEISPSGTGIRIFVKGAIPRNIHKAIEIYSHGFYVTVTGQRWPL
jgi:putative DNA primase/helicase